MKHIEHIAIKKLDVSVYKIPTNTPEADGTIEWDSTTMVFVKVFAADECGIGYSYAPMASASVVFSKLRQLVVQKNAMDITGIHHLMVREIRNSGNTGIAMMAVSAVDNALWDLKAKLLGLPLCDLLGKALDKMLVYGSGGFTSYTDDELREQFSGWEAEGFRYVKMKIGADFNNDPHRIRVARESIGDDVGLFVDANGALTTRQAIRLLQKCCDEKIEWFEEPVTSDNLDGLAFLRTQFDTAYVAAGEYGYNLPYFKHMLAHKAVDVLQADATRCGGITGFLRGGTLAQAFQIPFSSHCAPSIHLHAALALPEFYIAEYFYDHERIEKLFFDGFRSPRGGYMTPDTDRPGLGLELREKDAKKYLI